MDLIWGLGVAAVTGTTLFVAAPAALAVFGFTGSGIVTGSAAAAWQASIGNVVAGSAFSALQAAGAAGVVTTTTGVAASAAAGGIAAAIAH
ncbi:interferon alpha-inducible protein 27-like protein 2A [Contarinia nasturtii]|uniref:interferon alpha-inducible protein 27-like protein 2A n=1 Tax=Contarinia nasturtii TaxID=265458 RepID=UPI0012D43688|nr:interferon alpha-inducible protein 27-like protein 2A [Contarinia nasturtii]